MWVSESTQFVEHRLRYQGDPILSPSEATRIFAGVLTDDHALGNGNAVINDASAQTRAPAYLDFGQEH